MAYTLDRFAYRGCKSRLTRAQKTGDPRKILDAAEFCLRLFEEKGYPDDWSRWERAAEDARRALGMTL